LWCAEVDSGQFSQVINNIVINAKQSMPEGGIVEISAENITFTSKQCQDKSLPIKAGKYIRISIKDHGLGIPARHLDKIFDPFFTTKQTGSGLGLATSFSIMRNHGGYISVESEVGTGSTFIIFVRASTKAAPKYKEVTSIQPVIGGKILVMDDNAMVREIAGRMLNHIGCQEIEFAADGAEAITLFKKAQTSGKPFSAVILDLTIPGAIGGIETVKELLKLNPDTKAIVSSGYAGQPVMEEYKHYGFSGAVAKPYTIDQLHNALSGL
jgi:CheY-like chemotaxis protein